jgi:tetratricopeptide (TPR) repeat protein
MPKWKARLWLVVAGLSAALCDAALAAPPAYDSGGTGTPARLLAAADRAAYHGRLSEALADDSKALAMAPAFGGALRDRAEHEMDMGLYAAAGADYDRVIAMHPDDMGLAMDRVKLALRQGDGAGAMAALKHALTLPLYSSWHQPEERGPYESGGGVQHTVNGHIESYADEYSSIANQLLHHDDASLLDMQNMLRLESVHPEHILANYCYEAAIAGLLESAELMCQEAISDNPHDIGQYDSLGYVHLRLKQWDKAIADYNKAIDDRPDLTLSLYGRGVARRANRDVAGGDADIAKATRDEPDIAVIMRRLGAGG